MPTYTHEKDKEADSGKHS